MSTQVILATSWLAGFLVSVVGLAWAIKPARHEWGQTLALALLWPLTLIAVAAAVIMRRRP